MMRSILSFLLLGALSSLFAVCPTTSTWNFDDDLQCWELQNSLSGSVSDGLLTLSITAGDPFMISPENLEIDAAATPLIIIGMQNMTADVEAQIFFTTTTSGGFAAARRVSFTIKPNDTEISEYVVDMSSCNLWSGTVNRLRIDPNASSTSGNLVIDYVRVLSNNCTPQEINFTAIGDKSISDPSFQLDAISDAELDVSYELISGPATIDGSTVTLTGVAGEVYIKAFESGGDGICAAEEVQSFLVIDPDYDADGESCFADSWVATDALGRTVATYDEVGALRRDKVVGVFYYIWHGHHGNEVYDITKILDASITNNVDPVWGPENKFHFWGEPEYGYYRSEDPWVIRRDIQMLSNAKVDFVFFDVTNRVTYLNTVRAFCEVSKQMRLEGVKTPNICFTTHSNVGATVNELYDDFYSLGEYSDQWFYWEGKPLILADKSDEGLSVASKDFFTMKFSWAWTSASTTPDHWQWIDTYPQDFGWSTDRAIADQLTVSVASHPNKPLGTSYSNNTQPEVDEHYLCERTGEGVQFEEQWSRLEQVDPKIVMVTQWNEWVAQRFIWDKGLSKYAGRTIRNGDSHFVDAFTEEFNRDMAPMKGGHTDNYYYQLVSHIRQFKGMGGKQAYTVGSVNIDGDFDDWSNVKPNFRDRKGDTMDRDFSGYDPTTTYTNHTGRNDIVSAKVSYDATNLYMYVACEDDLTSNSDGQWMTLFLDVDKDMQTGWEGFDYIVDFAGSNAQQTNIKKWNGTKWLSHTTAAYSSSSKTLEIAIPKSAIEITAGVPTFYFKWADNYSELIDASAFFLDGDAAPDRRFKYEYNKDLESSISMPSSEEHGLKIYPNPASETATVEVLPNSVIEVFNLNGRRVLHQQCETTNVELDLQSLLADIYLVRNISKDLVLTQKLVVN